MIEIKYLKFKSILSNYKYILFIFIVLALAASIQSLLQSPNTFHEGGIEYENYNNY